MNNYDQFVPLGRFNNYRGDYGNYSTQTEVDDQIKRITKTPQEQKEPKLYVSDPRSAGKDRSTVSYGIEYIDVNSKFRNKNPYVITESAQTLYPNPLTFTQGSTSIVIDVSAFVSQSQQFYLSGSIIQYNNPFSIGDLITLNGIEVNFIKLRSIVNNVNTIQFTQNSKYAEIIYTHGIPTGYTGTYIQVEICDVKTVTGSNYIGNISLNSINKIHTVYVTKPTESLFPATTFSATSFYIELPREFIGVYTPVLYTFSLRINAIYGIPLNLLNTSFPISTNALTGYHVITNTVNVGACTITIEVGKQASTNGSAVSGGGLTVQLAKVINVIHGYKHPHNYVIQLPKIINNVTSISLVSTEFPNSISQINNRNNALYWQNLNDGDIIYQANINNGNYNISTLETEINKQMSSIQRINQGLSYNVIQTFNITIDESTSRVKIYGYQNAVLVTPITATEPDIQAIPDNDNFPDNTQFIVTINHVNHGLCIGDQITLSNCLSHMGIPENVLNTTQTIYAIIDDNNYSFQLPIINLCDNRQPTGGGNGVNIVAPLIFRMRFDYNFTCGELLGFRDVGESYAITPYNTIATNYNPYENDITTDAYGNALVITNNQLNLSYDDYILMALSNISNIKSLCPVENIFAKIQLIYNSKNHGRIFNSFVHCSKIFVNPIAVLDELHITFYDKNGNIYDFGGLDHSFTLDIRYIVEQPLGTGLGSKLTKFINQREVLYNEDN